MPAAIAAGSVCGEKRSTGAAGASRPGIEPDHLAVGRPRALVVRLGGKQLGAPDVEAGLRLRHVGRGDVAVLQPGLGLAQLLAQHVEVGALQFEDAGLAQQVHVGGGGVEQHGRLDAAQRLAGGEHLALGKPGAVGGLETVEQVLRRGDADAARHVGAALREISGSVALIGVVEPTSRIVVDSDCMPDVGGRDRPRPVAGQRGRHVLVGGANQRALRIDLRIVGVGVGQRLLRACRPAPPVPTQPGRSTATPQPMPQPPPRPSGSANARLPTLTPSTPGYGHPEYRAGLDREKSAGMPHVNY